ncbi:uncharacterized protein BDR25DRAFT_265269 [Lindgomyces ingoldianus]|uniref:Uncharacterized protein n=1 Tax=Lindgomyces ingoldianus TaxID=673940 RepID=A0ACB6QQH3_9PLEO|nr:uncharacterized protein BDR25DRAFT_265269 [Lindgomyces ingoldianus]KAF2468537.1 hypothetical protein BDR25DRAFT_265269 [Lindgomyces ingoldianus]
METNPPAKDETNRKRPCKGIRRACWECKKRRLHGSMTSEGGVSSPAGISSLPTEYLDDENPPCPLHLGERLGKLEQLFEKFVCRKFSSSAASSEAPRSPTLVEDMTERQSKFVYGLPEISSDTQSISSIGENILASQLPKWNSAPSIRTLVDSGDSGSGLGSEAIRRSLIALLPSQRDADVIFESTNGWMILTSVYRPAKCLFVNQDPQSYALDMSAIGKDHPVVIARTLLHLAICIDTLPPTFETSRLSHIWSLEAAMENYVTTVTSLVTSSDEQMSTLPGLETLQLLAAYHMNSGNLRQAWLVIRRAMNLAHLMGFHRIIAQPTPSPTETIEAAKFTWRCFIDADRFLSLHLRLPFASDEYPRPEDAHPALLHRWRLAGLSRQISELDCNVTSQTYVQALALDEKLEAFMKEMSKEFWDVPNVPPTARTPESAEVLERLVVQIWHFELKIFVHLPFLLRATQETRFEYSKITALQASRNVILRWFALRNSGITQACCRIAELGVFMATVTMALNILTEMATKDKQEVQKTRGGDFAMVCRVIGELEKLAKGSTREKIANRSAIVIKRILSSLDPSRRTAGKTRLTIPYFGSIDIGYQTQPVRPPFDLDSDTGKKLNSTATGSHLPVFSFVSNALWPSTEGSWGGELDFDIILFDGLEDRDTDGNWVF